MDKTTTPYGRAHSYYFEYPEEIQKRIRYTGIDVPIRDLFEMMARDIESSDPQRAAFFRLVAAHHPHCDENGYAVERDSRGAILFDFDDWDSLSIEEKLTRGNINATIAIIERLRFDLEKMNDDPANNEKVSEIRRIVGKIVEDRL